MAYDAARREVVLFGGTSDPQYYADTWTWNGASWTKRDPPTSPPQRAFMGMAYDGARREVVLFGGWSGYYLRDTWVWDGVTWTERHPAFSPQRSEGMGMAYDAARRNVVLFGGAGRDGFLKPTVWHRFEVSL